ncbi:MAG: iron-sulfur cluster repair di-iron protein [Euryarchaeota archaeon]|jgi:regulator of cell morphogenesis and NO signaling|nr:iron-sulfur cluster repair di-iron protein [Euryarchaeota archaeon]MDP6835318.1 iron-sulfur cluster repair di-iron protein [Candidatus Poseidoniia archaeon]MDP7007266.1 iron-sulfur cluster repair di-iron protein [Candidatus Poseidoniia archaeon]|tara:strand:+ start:137 stop:841 length:705 start_codon:yes stop_codon:yes gene_type:complete
MIKEKTVGEMVVNDGRVATVFNKFGLDFCCNGHQTLEAACASKGINLQEIVDDIELLMKNDSNPDRSFNDMSLDKLIEHIYDKHHQYIYKNCPAISKFINKVANVHGKNHPETVEIAKMFDELQLELEQHLFKEEHILFPYVKGMVLEDKCPGSFVNGPISVMMEEHDNAGRILEVLRRISNNYKPPKDACNTFRAAYVNLQALEEDLHMHIHLENNILFPKAIELENSLLENV